MGYPLTTAIGFTCQYYLLGFLLRGEEQSYCATLLFYFVCGVGEFGRLTPKSCNLCLIELFFFLREFQPMVSISDDNFVLSDQDTNRFLVQVGIKPQTLIQPSETLSVELTETHMFDSTMFVRSYTPSLSQLGSTTGL